VRSDLVKAVPAGPERRNAHEARGFFEERLVFWLRDLRGFAYDVVNAVVAVRSDNMRDAIARAEALTAVRGSEDLAAIAAAFKRIKNILRQAEEKGRSASWTGGERGQPGLIDGPRGAWTSRGKR